MVVKHTLVLALIVLGVYLDRGIASHLTDGQEAEQTSLLNRFDAVNGILALGGVLVIALTAVAQGI
jgi:hypothetical protein